MSSIPLSLEGLQISQHRIEAAPNELQTGAAEEQAEVDLVTEKDNGQDLSEPAAKDELATNDEDMAKKDAPMEDAGLRTDDTPIEADAKQTDQIPKGAAPEESPATVKEALEEPDKIIEASRQETVPPAHERIDEFAQASADAKAHLQEQLAEGPSPRGMAQLEILRINECNRAPHRLSRCMFLKTLRFNIIF